LVGTSTEGRVWKLRFLPDLKLRHDPCRLAQQVKQFSS